MRSATELAERMGRTPIRAADRIGFVANRCARPFFLESLRILGDGSRATRRSTGSPASGAASAWGRSS